MNAVTAAKALSAFPALIKEIHGNPKASFIQISAIENILENSLVFINSEKFVPLVNQSKATVVLVPLKIDKSVLSTDKTWLFCSNPELAMRELKKEYFFKTPYRTNLFQSHHATAVIDQSALIDDTAEISPGAVINAGVEIGPRSFIGANAVIEKDVKIGSDTTIHPLVYVGHSCIIGNHCEIKPNTTIGGEGYGYAHDHKGNHYRIPHTGRVILHDHVHVGSSCTIDRGTIEDSIIGEGTKIDNQCHLAHNSIVGKNCLITAQFGMAGSSKIGNNFISGGKASVTGHISIADNVQISGMSGVTKSIEESGQYGGFPLQPLKDSLKTKAAMVHLHELRKQLQDFLKNKS